MSNITKIVLSSEKIAELKKMFEKSEFRENNKYEFIFDEEKLIWVRCINEIILDEARYVKIPESKSFKKWLKSMIKK